MLPLSFRIINQNCNIMKKASDYSKSLREPKILVMMMVKNVMNMIIMMIANFGMNPGLL